MQRPRLLVLYDLLIKSDPAPPLFAATLVIAVLDGPDLHLWRASFTRERAEVGFVDEVPDRADAVVLVGAREAEDLLSKGPLCELPKLAGAAGDPGVIARMRQRYFVQGTWLQLQAEAKARVAPRQTDRSRAPRPRSKEARS